MIAFWKEERKLCNILEKLSKTKKSPSPPPPLALMKFGFTVLKKYIYRLTGEWTETKHFIGAFCLQPGTKKLRQNIEYIITI